MNYVPILNNGRSYHHVPCTRQRVYSDELIEWLVNTDGGDYSLGGNGVYFYDEKDAVLFMLTWAWRLENDTAS